MRLFQLSTLALLSAASLSAFAQTAPKPKPEDTEVWKPVPPVVTPGATYGVPPAGSWGNEGFASTDNRYQLVENFSIGPDGVGCYLPYTLSGYGTMSCFAAQDDIYSFQGGAPSAIGGNAKKSIFRDLASASSTPFGRMVGSFGNYVDYLTYWLAIPQQNDTIDSLWVYHFDDTSWINVQWPYGAMRCVANVATA